MKGSLSKISLEGLIKLVVEFRGIKGVKRRFGHGMVPVWVIVEGREGGFIVSLHSIHVIHFGVSRCHGQRVDGTVRYNTRFFIDCCVVLWPWFGDRRLNFGPSYSVSVHCPQPTTTKLGMETKKSSLLIDSRAGRQDWAIAYIPKLT